MTAWLEHLSDEECRERLATSVLGRIAVLVDGHPEIFPVNHVYDHDFGVVAFPSNGRTKLHAALNWPFVAFEVDGMDDEKGWSVLVVGNAEEIIDPSRVNRFARLRSVRWSPAPAHWLQIRPTSITGRRISYVMG